MKTHIKKLDDINFILSGSIDKSTLDKKRSKLIEKQKQALKKETTLDSKAIAKKIQEMDIQLQKEAQSHVLQNFMEAAMKKANIDPNNLLGQPNFSTYEERTHAIDVVVELSLRPTINTEIEYLDVIPSYQEREIPSDTIMQKLHTLAIQQAPYTLITEKRAVAHADLVVIDFQGFHNGRALEGGDAQAYKLKIGSNTFMPGFEKQMIGMQVNEKKRLKITFPQNYKAKELAGKQTDFDVTLHEIWEQVALNIDDALAQKVLDDTSATLQDLKEMLHKQAKSEAFLKLLHHTLKPKIIAGLLKKFDFTLPTAAIEQEIDAKVNALAQNMSQEERKVYQESKEKFQELRSSVRDEAKQSIKAALIVEALAKKENINVTEEEVISALELQAQALGKDPQGLVTYYQTNNLMTAAKIALIEEKLFTLLLTKVKK